MAEPPNGSGPKEQKRRSQLSNSLPRALNREDEVEAPPPQAGEGGARARWGAAHWGSTRLLCFHGSLEAGCDALTALEIPLVFVKW